MIGQIAGAVLLIGGAFLLAQRKRAAAGGAWLSDPELPGEGASEAPAPADPGAPIEEQPFQRQVRPAGRLLPIDVLAGADWQSAGVLPSELLAHVETESGFNPNAYRFEPHLGEASWGLMQVLESTARQHGLVGPPDQMFDPWVSLDIGLKHIVWTRNFLVSRGLPADPLSVALAYNAGVGNALRGRFSEQHRRRWLANWQKWQGQGYA